MCRSCPGYEYDIQNAVGSSLRCHYSHPNLDLYDNLKHLARITNLNVYNGKLKSHVVRFHDVSRGCFSTLSCALKLSFQSFIYYLVNGFAVNMIDQCILEYIIS